MSSDGCELVGGGHLDRSGGDGVAECVEVGGGFADGPADPRLGDAEQGGQGGLLQGPALGEDGGEQVVGGGEQAGPGIPAPVTAGMTTGGWSAR